MQFSLRYLMDTCINNLRIIFITTNIDKMDDTVQSRCCLLNVPQSPDSDIIKWIQTISEKEQIQLSKDEISNAIKNSDYNLNKILIYLFGMKSNISYSIK